jgi:hypothetical protein
MLEKKEKGLKTYGASIADVHENSRSAAPRRPPNHSPSPKTLITRKPPARQAHEETSLDEEFSQQRSWQTAAQI